MPRPQHRGQGGLCAPAAQGLAAAPSATCPRGPANPGIIGSQPRRQPPKVSFFVCPGGVVISLFQKTGRAVSAPVLARLRGMQSLLVDSEDSGVLLQVRRRGRDGSQGCGAFWVCVSLCALNGRFLS